MSMRNLLAGGALLGSMLAMGQSFAADAPKLGKPLSEADIKAWDITILPDGTNLPPGSGTVAQGAKLYVDKGCIACHGPDGKGGSNAALADDKAKLDRIEANKTIANFWAQATTLFDFIRRAMPYPQPRTLSDNETYALTAYVLHLNKLIGENDTINAETLPKVKMPNRDNFIVKFPDQI